MLSFYEQVHQYAQQSRAWRLAGNKHHGYTADLPLIGFCYDNAYVTHHRLKDNNIQSKIIEGTTTRVADDLIQHGDDPRTYNSTTELAGCVHYWLHVTNLDGEDYYVDIASDTHDRLGDCLITTTLPEDYIILPDSYEQGRKLLQTTHKEDIRCRYCGDHRYDYGGCPACHDTQSSDLET